MICNKIKSSKSVMAFRTISEVSEILDIPKHVLRFWESKFPQIKPLKRGGGRRYYRPKDLQLLKVIRDLLYNEGYTIRGAQKILSNQLICGDISNIKLKNERLLATKLSSEQNNNDYRSFSSTIKDPVEPELSLKMMSKNNTQLNSIRLELKNILTELENLKILILNNL
ncbi:MAG: MerR family transcriptional regulator [Rhodospirillaceae bacterium]|nr:MerR family transcriptional regulator [Rhodospirillaceae bacterium]